MFKVYKIYVTVLVLIFMLPAFSVTEDLEYAMKAVFLERFTRFVEWPAEYAISDTTKPFILGIVGSSRLGSILEKVYASQTIRDKHVEIRYISDLEDIVDCHLLFISRITLANLSRILAYTRGKPILTVSDTRGFAMRGVLINLNIEEDRIRFEINEGAVHESGLYMSYHLLKLAKIVNPVGGRE